MKQPEGVFFEQDVIGTHAVCEEIDDLFGEHGGRIRPPRIIHSVCMTARCPDTKELVGALVLDQAEEGYLCAHMDWRGQGIALYMMVTTLDSGQTVRAVAGSDEGVELLCAVVNYYENELGYVPEELDWDGIPDHLRGPYAER